MTPFEFRKLLYDLDLHQTELSRLVGVTPRAVNLWATGQRPVPGPIIAYLRLLHSLPQIVQDIEVGRLRRMPKKKPNWVVDEADDDPD